MGIALTFCPGILSQFLTLVEIIMMNEFWLRMCLIFLIFLGEVALIRLRNPWGHTEWKGAWSDSSEKWQYLPDDVKTDKIDGEFFIALEDFLRVSNHTMIVFVKRTHHYYLALLITSPPVDLYWFFEISIRTEKRFQLGLKKKSVIN